MFAREHRIEKERRKPKKSGDSISAREHFDTNTPPKDTTSLALTPVTRQEEAHEALFNGMVEAVARAEGFDLSTAKSRPTTG